MVRKLAISTLLGCFALASQARGQVCARPLVRNYCAVNTPTDGQSLTFSAAQDAYVWATISGGGSVSGSGTSGTLAKWTGATAIGNATCTESGGAISGCSLSGNASTATALAANPSDCSANQFAMAIAASGNLTCAQPLFSDLSGAIAGSQLPSYSNGFIAPINTQIIQSSTNSTLAGAGAAVGQATCGRFTQLFNITATKLYIRESAAGGANQECDAGIFSADGTTMIAHMANQACNSTNSNIGVSNLSFALTAGTDYLACVAASITATLTLSGSANATSLAAAFGATSAVLGSTTAGNKAAFNTNCTGSGAPYTCCTGSGTGTCTGFQGSIGTLTTNTASVIYVAVGT